MATPAHTTIRVTLFNTADQSIIDASDVPVDQLPEQFEVGATLRLGHDIWQVHAATPAQATQFMQTGELTLELKHMERINPQNILFSLPTISSELPEMAPGSSFQNSRFEWELQEDDWRQYEFLLPKDRDIIEHELQDVTTIWNNHRQETGDVKDGSAQDFYAFNRLHVRKTISEPKLTLPFKTLQTTLCKLSDVQTLETGALKIHGHTGYVENGFAIRTPLTVFYGTLSTDSQTVTLLGLCPQDDAHATTAASMTSLIESITQAHKLLFVNWCGCEIIPA